jgi:S1-C subfamily serine protease
VAFSPDGRFVLGGGCDEMYENARAEACRKGIMKLWDVTTGKEIWSFRHSGVARLGVEFAALFEDDRQRLQWNGEGGVRVERVLQGQPAEAAGLKADDILLTVGGQNAMERQQTINAIRAYEPGSTVQFSFWRRGQKHDIGIVLGSTISAGQSN